MAERLRGTDEGEASLLLLPEHLDLDARNLAIACTTSSRFRASRIAAVATGRITFAPSSSARRTWVATTSATSSIFAWSIAPSPPSLADPGVGALLHHLAQLPFGRLGDEHAGGVGADVDRGAEHPGRAGSIIADATDTPVPARAEKHALYRHFTGASHGGAGRAEHSLEDGHRPAAQAPRPQRPAGLVAGGAAGQELRGGRLRLGAGPVPAGRGPRSAPRLRRARPRRRGPYSDVTGLDVVVHGPSALLAGTAAADRVFEGLLAYTAEAGARQVVYHARNLPDAPASDDRLLAETRSLARHARLAERLGVTIAVENLAPVFPGPERLGHLPAALRTLVRRISSPALGLCLDLGHAHIVSELRRCDPRGAGLPGARRDRPVPRHDNFGARREARPAPELDPLRLDLHLPPGRGTLPWARLAPRLRAHHAPVVLEVHPPHRPSPAALAKGFSALLARRPGAARAGLNPA
jgi:sugar phosphate isomerase/epimerase